MIAGELVAMAPIRVERPQITPEIWASHRRALLDVLAREHVDLVHMHCIEFFEILPPPGVPVLITLHMPPNWYSRENLEISRPNTWLQGVSHSQHQSFGGRVALRQPIPNGVPIHQLHARHAKRDFALCLTRICQEKGVHVALDAAKKANKSLLVAGEVFPFQEHIRYMKDRVEPEFDGQRRFLGPLGFDRKRRYLTAARCILLPVQEPETSCLVAMEAFACGTPIIAFPMGAIAEIVEHGRTGYLVNDTAEMADAMHRVDQLDPAECRRFAREHFSLDLMVDRYIARYRQLLAGESRQSASV